MPRKIAVAEQLGNAGWKKEKGYGYRWIVEPAFSSIKHVFGEHIPSIKWKNIINELLLKASIYNLFMAMNPQPTSKSTIQGKQSTNNKKQLFNTPVSLGKSCIYNILLTCRTSANRQKFSLRFLTGSNSFLNVCGTTKS
jgi:hypothetical protein